MTNAPKTRVVDAFTGVVAGEPDTEAAELDHLRHVNGELNCRVQELETEVAELKDRLHGIAVSHSDQEKSDRRKAADKARRGELK